MLVFAIFAARSKAEGPNVVEAWFHAEINRRSEPLAFLPIKSHLVIDYITRSGLSESKFLELSASVVQKPDHPSREEYELEKIRRSPPGLVERLEFWFYDSQRWRLSTTPPPPNYAQPGIPVAHDKILPRFADVGRNPSGSWSLSPNQLLLTAGLGTPDGQNDPDIMFQTQSDIIDLLYSGGIGALLRNGLHLTNVRTIGKVSQVEFAKDAKAQLTRLEVVWDEAAHRPLVQRLIYIDSKGRSSGGWLFDNWKEVFPNIWIASSAKSFGEWLASPVEYRIAASSLISEAEITPLIQTPSEQVDDVLRGPPTFVRFVNASGPALQVQTRPRFDAPLQKTISNPEGSALRLIGWIVCGCIVAAVVVLRVRKG